MTIDDRRIITKNGRRYLVLTLRELEFIREDAPHRLVLVNSEWCVEIL